MSTRIIQQAPFVGNIPIEFIQRAVTYATNLRLEQEFDNYLSNRVVTLHNGCIVDTNRANAQGYGVICSKHRLARKYAKLLHRAVYIRHKGPIPDGKCIMHTCDNRQCVNIEHLVCGTWTKGYYIIKLN